MKKTIIILALLLPVLFACKKEATNVVLDPQLRVRNETTKTLENINLRDHDLNWGTLAPGAVSDFLAVESIWYYMHHLVEADIDGKKYSIFVGYCGNDSSFYRYHYKGNYEIVIENYAADNHSLTTRLEPLD